MNSMTMIDTTNLHMNYYDLQNIITYFDCDMRIIVRRINKQFKKEVFRNYMIEFGENVRIELVLLEIKKEIKILGYRDVDMYEPVRYHRNPYERFKFACFTGNIKIIDSILGEYKGYTMFTWDGQDIACRFGKLYVIKYLLNNRIWRANSVILSACRYDCMNIVKYLSDIGALIDNDALYFACSNGNQEIVDFIIKKGVNDWNKGLSSACMSEKRNIISLMIEKGATYCTFCNKSMQEHLTEDKII